MEFAQFVMFIQTYNEAFHEILKFCKITVTIPLTGNSFKSSSGFSEADTIAKHPVVITKQKIANINEDFIFPSI